ncbi:MAG TPA: LysM peptidoglycan-binding domain-containing protein [Anaerolineales bacterium]|nr:LysM peptidoglycan-binding domain-containing protein [Anaerolineales bacterium]
MNVRSSLHAGAACYTVQSGDSLSRISQQFYGNMRPDSVNRIHFTNIRTIGSNPNLIRPGQRLLIPDPA